MPLSDSSNYVLYLSLFTIPLLRLSSLTAYHSSTPWYVRVSVVECVCVLSVTLWVIWAQSAAKIPEVEEVKWHTQTVQPLHLLSHLLRY